MMQRFRLDFRRDALGRIADCPARAVLLNSEMKIDTLFPAGATLEQAREHLRAAGFIEDFADTWVIPD